MTIPFTYRIYCIPENKYYYGVRYCKNAHPTELWTTYFTSSKYIKVAREKYGDNAFTFEIRKQFDTPEEAVLWEQRVLTKVMKWSNYYNDHNGKAFSKEASANGIRSFWKNASEEDKEKRRESSRKSIKLANEFLKNNPDIAFRNQSNGGKAGVIVLKNRGHFQTQFWRDASSLGSSNTVWCTDGIQNKRIKLEKVTNFLDQKPLWKTGTTKTIVIPENKGRIYLHKDGFKKRFVHPDSNLAKQLVSDGYYRKPQYIRKINND